jgi:hypothetical protein
MNKAWNLMFFQEKKKKNLRMDIFGSKQDKMLIFNKNLSDIKFFMKM